MVFARTPASRSSLPVRSFGALVGLAIALSACSTGSGFQYVSSSDRKAFFKVPHNWKFYDKRDILVASGQSLSGETNRQVAWLIGFDSDPSPSLDHVIDITVPPEYPVVQARVVELAFQTRDQIALGTLRNVFYPVDELAQSNAAEILSYEDVVTDDGFRGSKMVYDIIVAGVSGIVPGNAVIRVNQTAVLDSSSQRLYLFTIRCESHCYEKNKSLIDQIASSWTVKEQ
jgi:hypothetical protein